MPNLRRHEDFQERLIRLMEQDCFLVVRASTKAPVDFTAYPDGFGSEWGPVFVEIKTTSRQIRKAPMSLDEVEFRDQVVELGFTHVEAVERVKRGQPREHFIYATGPAKDAVEAYLGALLSSAGREANSRVTGPIPSAESGQPGKSVEKAPQAEDTTHDTTTAG